jgi:hypothetical protein
MSAYVMNSDDVAATEESLDWLLHAIFPTDAMRQAVLDRIGDRLRPLATLAQARAVIATFAQVEATRGTAFGRMVREQVQAHEQRAIANVHAYRPKRSEPDSGFWPDPRDPMNGRSLYEELPTVRRYGFIDRTTKIASAGSCFAIEIARSLQRDGFNYLVAEAPIGQDGSYRDLTAVEGLATASAAWGAIYNAPAFRQLVWYAFGVWDRPEIVFNLNDKTLMDPFREDVHFDTVEGYECNRRAHQLAARRVFVGADVLVITLGLNEVWVFAKNGSAFSRNPWRTAPSLVERRILTVAENVEELEQLYSMLKIHNSDIKLIVSLSPVPFHATFRHDEMHVVEANTLSKSVLRVAADEFCRRHDDAYYFPSYELVTTCTKEPWEADERHVSRAAVDRVMQMFRYMFVKPER